MFTSRKLLSDSAMNLIAEDSESNSIATVSIEDSIREHIKSSFSPDEFIFSSSPSAKSSKFSSFTKSRVGISILKGNPEDEFDSQHLK